jgi:hypothetical protein
MRETGMLRIWLSGAGPLLWSYLALAVLELAYIRQAGGSLNGGMGVNIGFETVGGTRQAGWPAGFALEAFLIWRVWRGGVLAWAALLTLNGWSALIWGAAFVVQLHGESGMTGHETGSASPYLLGLLGFSIAALVLLTSPAIRARTAHAQRAVADG